MSRRSHGRRFYDDAEVAELFADEPELLAVVDAIAQAAPAREELSTRSRARRYRAPAFVAAVAAAAVALLVLPWRGEGLGLVERAAAAVSDGAVVHARVSRETDDDVTVDLGTGQETPGRIEVETWYDERRARLRTRTFRNGVAVADVVSRSRAGTFPAGPDPAVMLFATGYRQALEEGRAEIVDRDVLRLRIAVGPTSQLVTLDPSSFEPVAFRTGQDAASVRWAVDEIDARPRVERDFIGSGRTGAQSGLVARARRGSVASLARAGSLWLGRRFAEFTLSRIYHDTLLRVEASGETTRGSGNRLVYRSAGHTLQIQVARRPEPAYGYAEGRLTISFAPIPAAGSVHLSRPRRGTGSWVAQFRRQGWFVTVRAQTKRTALAAAERLGRVPAG
jgi:hypothetical protein